MSYGQILALFLTLSFSGQDLLPVPRARNIGFPHEGMTDVSVSEHYGHLPTVNFRSLVSGHSLSAVPREKDSVWPHEGKDWTIQGQASAPTVTFVVLNDAGLPKPAVAALFHYDGADDSVCNLSLVGEVDGKFSYLTPILPSVTSDGGYGFLNGPNPRLWVWDRDKTEPRINPKRMKVREYALANGTFQLKNEWVASTEEIVSKLPRSITKTGNDFRC